MNILSLDPSSTLTGYATFARGVLGECGYFRPRPKDEPVKRILSIVSDLAKVIDDCDIDTCVIETTQAMTGHANTVRGASLITYGMAVGAIITAAAQRCGPSKIYCVPVGVWTRKKSKESRKNEVLMLYPHLAAAIEKDKGGDLCDAIMLGEWWITENARPNRRTEKYQCVKSV